MISPCIYQTAEEVSFAANGITAAGIKAFDGVLQSNIVLKTLDLSGNPIGDEGVKVSPGFPFLLKMSDSSLVIYFLSLLFPGNIFELLVVYRHNIAKILS